MRLIDADALLEEHCGDCSLAQQKMCKNDPVCGSAMWIIEAPTIEAKPVVHGWWEWCGGIPWCSNCGEMPPDYSYDDDAGTTPYCPLCGAKMDSKQKA